MNIKVIGIDLAKNVFQVCALNSHGKVVSNQSVSRAKLLHTLRQFESTVVAMEACATANFWARKVLELGHRVALIPAQHVKPFTRVGKSDAKDALAICEAAFRPNLHFVSPKSTTQQDLALLHNARESIIQRRTATMNRLRATALEYGVVLPKSQKQCLRAITSAIEDAENELTPIAREVLHDAMADWHHYTSQLTDIDKKIRSLAKQDPAFARLQTIPGVGPTVASALLASVGNGSAFKQGRHLSAWIGVIPSSHGSGGKTQLLSITKNGDRYLRKQIIHGARTVVSWAIRQPKDNAMHRWMRHLVETRGKNKAVVAYANKMARIAWAVLHHATPFELNKAFAN